MYGTRGGRGVSVDPTTRRTKPLREGPVVVLEGRLHAPPGAGAKPAACLAIERAVAGGREGKALATETRAFTSGRERP